MSDDHDDHDDSTKVPATIADPLPDPGLPAHTWRPTDVDERLAKRAERQVSLLFGISAVFTVLFFVSYFVFKIGGNWDTGAGLGLSTLTLGLTLGGALLCIGIGIIQWARKLMADHEIIEMRHPARSSDEDRAAALLALNEGIEESGIGRRPLIRNSLFGAVGVLLLAPIVMLRDLGPTPSQVAGGKDAAAKGEGLENTIWKKYVRVVRDVVGTPIRPGDLAIGDLVNAIPDGLLDLEGVELQVAKAKSAVIVVRMEPDQITVGKGRENWSFDGVICYSKICTHVGCPISLYERTTHHVLCPCHQSTFDLADSAKVIFGPAARPLPQLPLMVDDQGFLAAQSDFLEPVGPSYWERVE